MTLIETARTMLAKLLLPTVFWAEAVNTACYTKYVGEILKKFGFSSVRTANAPMETNKALTKDEDGEDVDVYLYRSMIGSLMYLTSSRPDIRLISWQCKKQTVVANSTTEAEYIAASHCCGQVLWIKNQMLDYGYNFMQTKIHVDNESAICVVKNPVYHSKIKHIEIRHHFIRDSCEKRLIKMVKIHIDNHVADLLNIAFDVSRFNFLVASIYLGADEAVHKERRDSVERAITIVASLDVVQDSDNIIRTQTTAMPNVDIPQGMDIGGSPRRQDTIGGAPAQTRSERVLEKTNEPPLSEGHTSGSRDDKLEHQFELTTNVPITPHDSPLPGDYTPGSDESRLKLQKLMTMCTKLSKQVLDLEKEKVAQVVEILRLKKRVKRLE
ncbi:hypothetical protein Tco_0964352 [Tanacetum coccineum]